MTVCVYMSASGSSSRCSGEFFPVTRRDHSIRFAAPILQVQHKCAFLEGQGFNNRPPIRHGSIDLDIEDQMHLSIMVKQGYFGELHRTGSCVCELQGWLLPAPGPIDRLRPIKVFAVLSDRNLAGLKPGVSDFLW